MANCFFLEEKKIKNEQKKNDMINCICMLNSIILVVVISETKRTHSQCQFEVVGAAG